MMIASPLKSGVDLSSLGPQFSGISTIVDCLLEEVESEEHQRPTGLAMANERPRERWLRPRRHRCWPSAGHVNGQMVADIFHCNSCRDPTRHRQCDGLLAKYQRGLPGRQRERPDHLEAGRHLTNHDSAQILTIMDDPETGFAGQHDARFQPNGDVSLYDDHTQAAGSARGVEYAIDTTTQRPRP